MMPEFQYIFNLILLVLLPVIFMMYWLAKRKKKRTLKNIGDPILVKKMLAHHRPYSAAIRFTLLFLAMALLILTFANLRLPTGTEKVQRTGIDLMIALDVSKSMLAKDVAPSRLERAKQFLGKLTDQMKDNRIGIVVFAGKAYLQMPLTSDLAAAKMYINSSDPSSIPTQGTVLADALNMSYTAFNPNEKKYKTILLVSDGEDHKPGAEDAAKELATQGVQILTVGMGSVEGTTLYDEETQGVKTDEQGQVVISKLNEATLQAIAKKGNGAYLHFSTVDGAVAFVNTYIKGMDQRTFTDKSLQIFKSLYPYLLGLTFLFLIIEMLLNENKKSKVMKISMLLVIGLIFNFSTASAQPTNKLIKEGNTSYNNQSYEVAKREYQKAIAADPANAKTIFNLGNAYYKAGQKDSALQQYELAAKQFKDAESRGKSFYNKGVVLQNDKKLPECIEAYKQALRLNQNDEDARHNLQKALQQQKDENKKKEEDKKKEQDKEKDQKPKPQQSKLTKNEAEEKLNALMQQEKKLQDKLHKSNAQPPVKPEKDW